MIKRSKAGMAVLEIILGASLMVFVVFPLFSAVIEKYILINKAQIIKDAIDMTNISTYNAIVAENLGRNDISFDDSKVYAIYNALLSENLSLDDNLEPMDNSVVDGKVTVKSLILYTNGFPDTCPKGTDIVRPCVHSCITVPIKPTLYRQILLSLMGKQYVEMEVHVDSDIPVNN